MGAMLVRHEAACVSSVRRELSLDLDLHGADQTAIDDAMVVVSELMSNAVRHSGLADSASLDVEWTIRRRDVLISVEDPSALPPIPVDAPADALGGRGLAIIAALSTHWGYQPTRTGKRVWARVALRH